MFWSVRISLIGSRKLSTAKRPFVYYEWGPMFVLHMYYVVLKSIYQGF